MSAELSNSKDYVQWLGAIKSRIHNSQQRAALKVNQELLSLYWFIGEALIQKQADWGDNFIGNLARDLKVEFPQVKGFSKRNLEQMRRWVKFHSEHIEIAQQAVAQMNFDSAFQIAQQAVAQLPEDGNSELDQKVRTLLFGIPWGHHQQILTKANTPQEAYFYIIKTIQNNWSRSNLIQQISSGLYSRQGQGITNFELTLPQKQGDLAQALIKNPYNFDFMMLAEDAKELEVERALIQNLKKFMLELGKGFAYVGNQYNLNVEGDDFFLDLLFFNIPLNCFVVVELKVGEFKPEFAGKLNMYVNTVNDQLKTTQHNNTIGLLLCKTPNKTVVEYSIKGIDSPLGISEYEYKHALPEDLKIGLPTVEELENEIEAEMQDLKTDLDKKKEAILALIQKTKESEITVVYSREIVEKIHNTFLEPLQNEIDDLIREKEINQWFMKYFIGLTLEGQAINTKEEKYHAFLEKKDWQKMELYIRLDGFKKLGTKAFQEYQTLNLNFSQFNFKMGKRPNDEKAKTLLYSEIPNEKERKEMAENIVGELMDSIRESIERMTSKK